MSLRHMGSMLPVLGRVLESLNDPAGCLLSGCLAVCPIAMGISGLHQVLKPYVLPVSVGKYKGQRVAIDGYAWLHRGACQAAGQGEGGNDPSQLHPGVCFCLRMLAMLQDHGVVPVVRLVLCNRLPSSRASCQVSGLSLRTAVQGVLLLSAVCPFQPCS